MFQRDEGVESEGMPHSKPFAWLLAVGMLCSLAGLSLVLLPLGAGAEENGLTPTTSAPDSDSPGVSNTVPTLVTEASPASTESPDTPLALPSTPSVATTGEVARVAATPTPAAVTDAPVAPSVQAIPAVIQQVSELERMPDKARGLVDAMNQARVDAGLPALDWDASLEDVAYARAQNLVDNGYFDHYAPDGESAFSELAARGIRYRLAGENLARNNYIDSRTVAAAFDGLMNSPGHRANILEERFSSVAVACVRDGKMWIYVTVFLN